MLESTLKSKINKLWELFWSGGIANPLTTIEQISYLIFMKNLDDEDMKQKKNANFVGKKYQSLFKGKQDLRWSHWRHFEAEKMLDHVRDKVFPFIKKLNSQDNEESFSTQMKDAVFIIPKPSLLVQAVEMIENLKIKEQNQDIQGDIYEYLLSELKTSGKNGQFRTPRHIIKMMCALIKPKLGQTVCDPACGTGGFLIGAYQYIVKENTSPKHITLDEEGMEQGLIGDKIRDKKVWNYLWGKTFYGFDFDSTMLRISAMNMVLHGIKKPNIKYLDSISKNNTEENRYDILLANPPFKGNIDKDDIHEALSRTLKTTRTELLFIAQMIRLLKTGGSSAVIVPSGVLFRSDRAHIAIRKKLLEETELQAVISMPSGVFKPYAGVSTAVLLFTKGGETEKVWFYDMTADGFSLDDKRNKVKENDIPDILEKWHKREKLKKPSKADKWFFVSKKKIEENDYSLNGKIYKEEVNLSHTKWPLVSLGEVCDIFNGSTPNRNNSSFWKDGTIPWFTVDDIRSQGRKITKTKQKITTEALKKTSVKLLPAKTVLLCCTASVGEYALTEIKLTTNQQFNGLVVNTIYKELLLPEFLFHLSSCFKDKLLRISGRTSFNFIPIRSLKKIKIPLPPLKVQKKIVSEIEEEQAHIESCKKLIKLNENKIQQKISSVWEQK